MNNGWGQSFSTSEFLQFWHLKSHWNKKIAFSMYRETVHILKFFEHNGLHYDQLCNSDFSLWWGHKRKVKKIQFQHLVEVNIPFGTLSVFCSWKKSWFLRELSLLRRKRAEMWAKSMQFNLNCKSLPKCSNLTCKAQRIFRSSYQRCSVKKAALKNVANLTEKHLCWSLILITLQVWRPATLSKK